MTTVIDANPASGMANVMSTTTPRPFRFGVNVHRATTREELVTLARRAEALGYSSLVVADHIGQPFSPMLAMLAVADATTSLRIGVHVLGNDFRNPVMLAKEAATLDLLSEGRLELGLGAGWQPADYERTGVPFDSPGVRINRLAEAIQVLKGAFASAFSGESFTFSGAHYTVQELTLRPAPVQRPRPPIVIGGGGRRILSLAGREADIVSVTNRKTPEGTPDFSTFSPESFLEGVGWVRKAAGDQFPKRELTMLVHAAHIDERGPRAAAEQQIDHWRLHGRMTAEQLMVSPQALLGTIDDVVETLFAHRERFGFSYPIINQQAIDTFAPVVARLTGK